MHVISPPHPNLEGTYPLIQMFFLQSPMEAVLPALLEQPDISINTALPSLSVPCCVVVGFVCLAGFTRVTIIVKRKEKRKKKKGRMYLEYLSKGSSPPQGMEGLDISSGLGSRPVQCYRAEASQVLKGFLCIWDLTDTGL